MYISLIHVFISIIFQQRCNCVHNPFSFHAHPPNTQCEYKKDI